ncbi:amidohydrolase family protein [Actinophytocola sp.]|uniref:amidohydrolase family protein n=1 Tax=Actinophytocola sp. TaxID=1872138 RepID=UPI003D6B6F28
MSELALAVLERRPLRGVTVIDAHAHTGPYSLFFIPDADAAGMVAVMDRCGVDVAVLSSLLGLQLDAAAGNLATARAVDAFPGRLLGYLTINPWHDPEAELAAWAGDPRFVGIKLHADLHGYPLTGSRYEPVWAHAERTGTPVLCHTWYGSPFDDPGQVARVAERYPDVVVLAGHAGGPEPGIDVSMEIAARLPNVVLETCGSFVTGHHLERMVDVLPPGQVVFGSDFPFIDLRHSLGRTVFARIGDAERAAILGGTAATLFGISDEQSH